MRTVEFVSAARRANGVQPVGPLVDLSRGWRPSTWLGAPASGGLALPAAHPTASWMYAPRGVHLGRAGDEDVLVVADTGNHRVMIWHGIPGTDEAPCDVVLGQPDDTTEGAAANGRGAANGMHLPTGVLIHDGMLLVADAWHHRVLVYATVPRVNDTPPDWVLGQDGPDDVEPNRGGHCVLDSLYWPFGINVVGGRFYVADTGNKRVLGWSGGVPSGPDVLPDVVLGQPDATHREENRAGPAGRASFRWPHGVTGTDGQLLVADAGNHRLLGWTPHPAGDRDAGLVIGQADFAASTEWPYAPQRADLLRFPYSADVDDGRLVVADTANNRLLLWDVVPSSEAGETGPPADAVLGQPTFAANGENRWDMVGADTLCWPYGVSLRGDLLAVSDSGNNRVMLWRRS